MSSWQCEETIIISKTHSSETEFRKSSGDKNFDMTIISSIENEKCKTNVPKKSKILTAKKSSDVDVEKKNEFITAEKRSEQFFLRTSEISTVKTSSDVDFQKKNEILKVKESSDSDIPKENEILMADESLHVEVQEENEILTVDDSSDVDVPDQNGILTIKESSKVDKPNESEILSLEECSDEEFPKESVIVTVKESSDVDVLKECEMNKDESYDVSIPNTVSTTEDKSSNEDIGKDSELFFISSTEDDSCTVPMSNANIGQYDEEKMGESFNVDVSKENLAVSVSNPETVDLELEVSDRHTMRSRVGEETPNLRNRHFVKKAKSIIQKKVSTIQRTQAPISPEITFVRNVPLPALTWCDTHELIRLIYYKEDVTNIRRRKNAFRRNTDLNTRMRAILFDWLMEVCDVYKLRRVTYYLAIDYIERIISISPKFQKQHLQLLGITCLFIAAKVEEIYPPKLSELAYVTDGACTDVDMRKMEILILRSLDWNMNPLTVPGWLSIYMQIACTQENEGRQSDQRRSRKLDDDFIYTQFSPFLFVAASMIVDLCSLDDGMLQFSYSVIAASAAYFVLNRERVLHVSGYTWERIQTCVEWMMPFAETTSRALSRQYLPTSRENMRNGSALRVRNPKIVLEDGHTFQTHVVDLPMLESAYREIQRMRDFYRDTGRGQVTGWTVTINGFNPVLVKKKVLVSNESEIVEISGDPVLFESLSSEEEDVSKLISDDSEATTSSLSSECSYGHKRLLDVESDGQSHKKRRCKSPKWKASSFLSHL